MEDYLKKQKRQRIKNYVVGVIICILLVFIAALLYLLYQNIYLPNTSMLTPPKIEVQRLSQTVEDAKKESKTVADVIEKVNESVVGISKIKNTGSTIFLQSGSSNLGLGTGMIISENGYILTNEHVSGAKYDSCYVTLIDRKKL